MSDRFCFVMDDIFKTLNKCLATCSLVFPPKKNILETERKLELLPAILIVHLLWCTPKLKLTSWC